MKKYLYPIYKLEKDNYIKWWLYNYLGKFGYVLSDILTGTEFYLDDSVNKKFNKFDIIGRTTQESTTGKNLFSGNFSQFNSSGGTGTVYGYFALPTNDEKYTLTIIAKNDFTPTASTYLGFSRNGGISTGGVQWIMSEAIGSMTKGQKRTLENLYGGNYYPFVSIFANTADTLRQFTDNFYIQLEKGEETDYEPYTGGIPAPNPQFPELIKNTGDSGTINEKVQNKNLLDFDDFLTTGGATYSKSDGVYTITDKGNIVTNRYQLKVISGKTYTLSCAKQEQTSTNVRVQLYKDGTFLGSAYATGTEASATTFTAEAGSVYTLNLTYSTLGTNIMYKNPMLEEDSTATDYQAHVEQNISFPLANGQKLMEGDYLAEDGIHHVRGQVVLDGSETWTNKNITDNYLLFSTNKIDGLFKTSNLNVISNYFLDNSNLWTDDTKSGTHLFNMSASLRFRINKTLLSDITTVENAINSFKTWLSNNNVTVEYELAEEVIETYTEEQQTAGEQIKALKTYKPVTHISSLDETKANLKIQYYKEG